MSDEIVRIVSLCIVLAGVETLHGIVRAAVLVPRIGKRKALKLSIVTGSILAFAVCYCLVPPIGPHTLKEQLGLGLILALFMATFDIVLSKTLLRRNWGRILDDFNPATGNYLLYGLLLLVCYPYLVMKL
ncbi:MAG: hypothetical protein GC149_07690 [Gammaproteobacteria bacterium]|nr:hypothetical protein [Gammaproteobacteria bacterium]